MPRGPKGQKRPADVIGAAIMVGRIATDEAREKKSDSAAAALGRKGGLKGGKARAAKMSADERRQAAKKAIEARWRKSRNDP
jgi:hypothetical protein